MLFQELGKMKRISIMSMIVLITIGIVMIICPVNYLGMLVAVLGYALVIAGTTMVLEFLFGKKVLIDCFYLTAGIVALIVGLIVLLLRGDVLFILSLLFGLVILVEGLWDLYSSYVFARRAGSDKWKLLVALSIVMILCAITLLVNPFWDTEAEIKMSIGLMMLFTSVVSIIRIVLTWPVRDS